VDHTLPHTLLRFNLYLPLLAFSFHFVMYSVIIHTSNLFILCLSFFALYSLLPFLNSMLQLNLDWRVGHGEKKS